MMGQLSTMMGQKRTEARWYLVVILLMVCRMAGAQTRLDYFMMEAAKCRMQDNISASMEMCRHCLEIDPSSPEALFQVGLVHIYMHEDSLGLDCLEKAVALDSVNAYYNEVLAGLHLRRSEIDEAVPLLERLCRLQPKRSDVLYQLANIYGRNEEYDRAIAVYDRMELLEGKLPSISRDKFSLYMQKGDSVSAFRELQSLCDEYPADMSYRIGMGYSYQQLGNFDEAMRIYDEVRRVDPDNMTLQMALMDYYQMQGQDSLFRATRDSILYAPRTATEERVELLRQMVLSSAPDSVAKAQMTDAFEHVLQVDSTGTDLLMLYALYLEGTKSPARDIHNVLVRVMAIAPDNEDATRWLLRYYGDQHDYPSLEEVCRKGANYHPENLTYHYFLGVALLLQGNEADALDAMGRGLRLRSEDANPDMVASMFTSMGDILHQMGKDRECFAQYDSALVYNPDDAMCLNNYAYFLSLKGENLDRAEAMSYRAVRAEPTSSTYLDTYAWILFMRGDYAGAAEYMDRIVPRDSLEQFLERDTLPSAVVLEHAGDIAWMNGDRTRAVCLWEYALRHSDKDIPPVLYKKYRKKRYFKAK